MILLLSIKFIFNFCVLPALNRLMKAIFQKVAVNSSPNACGCLNVIRNISPAHPRRYSTSGFDGKDGGVNKHNGVPPMVDVDYNEPQSLPLPVYPKRPDETLEVKKQRYS